MTVTADDRRRIVLPEAEPGDQFDIQYSGDGFTLRRLGQVDKCPAKVAVERRDGFSVWVTDQPITEQSIREALADFPP
jgi:hypothetical protein